MYCIGTFHALFLDRGTANAQFGKEYPGGGGGTLDFQMVRGVPLGAENRTLS